MGVQTLDIGPVTPKRHFLARLGCSLSQEPPPQKKVAESLCAEGREITHAQNRNPYTDFAQW